MVLERMRRLEAWRGPVPAPASQWIHGDYQDQNVIFAPSSDRVAAIIDWDNVSPVSREYEIMRAYNFSFPEGTAGGHEFLEGYVNAARPAPEEAAQLVDLWSYVYFVRLWPVDTRYEQPELYQQRWDVFIRQPSGWWEANRAHLRDELTRMASEAATAGT
jgi:Ser/Thr protein kinase RdoA (MazF antagonist)